MNGRLGERDWDFPYAPLPTAAGDDDGGACDVIVALETHVPARAIAEALAGLLASPQIDAVMARAPLFWWRVRSETAVRRGAIAAALASRDLGVRYVASATRTSPRVGPALSFEGVAVARAEGWAARADVGPVDDAPGEGRWFLRANEGGVAVDRTLGTGAGARLAVVDDDGAEADQLALDRAIPIGIDSIPCATSHGALMVAWAVGARRFQGVAPSASPRLYAIPKPGLDVVSLPLAIARAALDGADVVVCATYVEGSTSPMLDDALAVAHHLGRRGRGTAVVFPTGREASSPAGSVHSSWSLALGDPASDPRAFCVGPSARGGPDGGWFLWRDRRGRLRPFANRGPAVRWLAPGDDVAYPFGDRDRLFHAESSGASAIAAGVLLLVLAANPRLRVRELGAIVTGACTPLPGAHDAAKTPLADPADVLPRGVDRDGHNAKHGYGRVHAGRAVLAASDPVARALVAIGEDAAARTWMTARARVIPGVSPPLARWAVRALLADASLAHAASALARHARLVAGDPARQRAQGDGALARQLTLLVRALAAAPLARSHRVGLELLALDASLSAAEPIAVDRAAHELFALLWPSRAPDDTDAATDRFGSGAVRL